MSWDKKIAMEILKSVNIIPEKINKANPSGQKKVFFITVDGAEYVLKVIDVTPYEIKQEYDWIDAEIEDNQKEKEEIINEKISRIENELFMAKRCPILPQLKLLDSHRIFVDEDEHFLFYIEERFNGNPLDSFYKKKSFCIEEVLCFIEEMVKKVEIMYLHQYIHRDIKPANIIVEDSDYKIIDGGLCKYLDDDRQLTRTPDFIGTYRYAAPEQAKRNSSHNWDFTTDLFPIGLIAIEMYLKESRDFNEEHLRDMDYIYSKWKSNDLKTNNVFSKLIVRLCSKNYARRFADFEDIYNILESLKEKEVEFI